MRAERDPRALGKDVDRRSRRLPLILLLTGRQASGMRFKKRILLRVPQLFFKPVVPRLSLFKNLPGHS